MNAINDYADAAVELITVINEMDELLRRWKAEDAEIEAIKKQIERN